ncbi:murein L,D-transpeptidase [Rufibacter sp. DG15C]|uniref:L,D-transpeptidase family protein n=1 Tax=Rufibacter sp. DG15C TaxID=1379909 RepID=UPI00082B131F|nr:L,D-transpeptidase family protein [Rufibacter sp. DG15C]
MNRRHIFLVVLIMLLANGVLFAQAVTMTPASQQQALQKALLQYQSIINTGTWLAFPEDLCVQPGAQDKFVPKVRNLLCLTQDLTQCATQDSSFFDEHLVAAVKRFQKRHGLPADGIIGCRTLTALNVSPAQRVQQIMVNLARWQDSAYAVTTYPLVLVNIPDYRLHLLNNQAQTIWQTRVIVGQRTKALQTRQVNSRISYLVVRPTWNVPKSIIKNEIIPAVRRDRNYLAKNHMALYKDGKRRQVQVSVSSIHWKTVNPEDLTVIQSPGSWNALGKVKFIFHNPFHIYLHDTPVKSLFDHPVRAYSHGCVRVEQPEKLAAYLMNPDWGKPSSFSLQAQKGINGTVFLPKPVAVQIRYFTCWVDGQGVLQFRDDIYGLDTIQQLTVAPTLD